MKKRIISLVLATLLCIALLPVGALAAEAIEVRMGVNLQVNGAYYQPTDANGKDVPVFIYDGTTYLPIRAMTVMLGASIEWIPEGNLANVTVTGNEKLSNPKTTTVKSTWLETIEVSQNIKIFLNNVQWTPKNAQGAAVPILNYNGTTYAPVRAVSEALGFEIEWHESSTTVVIGANTSEDDIVQQGYAVLEQINAIHAENEENLVYLELLRSQINTTINARLDYLTNAYIKSELREQFRTVANDADSLALNIKVKINNYKTSWIRENVEAINDNFKPEEDLEVAKTVLSRTKMWRDAFTELIERSNAAIADLNDVIRQIEGK